MSILTSIQNFRATRKVSQLKNEAGQTSEQKPRTWTPVMNAAFVLAFVGLLVSLAGFGAPAAAAEINLTVISDVINAFTGIIEPITNLLISVVPLWFIMQILAFIMGLLAAILGMIKFGKMR